MSFTHDVHVLIDRFIRDDEEPSDVSWEERLARAYESKLFKEFALVSNAHPVSAYSQIDLKHFKSRRLALRWRTAEEVVDGIGEDTCAGLRCKHHQPVTPSPRHNRALWEDASTPGPSVSVRDDSGTSRHSKKRMPPLRSFELPFVYEEHGERKEALVKVKLCAKCQTKLAWKPGKDSGPSEEDEREFDRQSLPSSDRPRRPRSLVDRSQESDRHGRDRHHADSRSRSPESRHKHRRHR